MFKQNLERICAEKGLPPTSVCTAIGISKSNYSNWKEDSIPRKSTIIKLSNYLNVSEEELLSAKKTPPCKNVAINNSMETKIKTNNDCLIAYIDILGTKGIIERGETHALKFFNVIYTTLVNTINEINSCFSQNIVYRIFSDNIVLAVNYEEKNLCATLEFFLSLLSILQHKFLINDKILVRGSVCRGVLDVRKDYIMGSGLIKAYEIESTRAYFPRIIVEPTLYLEIKEIYPQKAESHISKDFDGEFIINFTHFCNEQEYREIETKLDIKNEINEKVRQKKEYVKNKYYTHCFCKILCDNTINQNVENNYGEVNYNNNVNITQKCPPH